MEIYSYEPFGYNGVFVRVECDIRRGLPTFTLVGLPGAAVREARDRVHSAMLASVQCFPSKRITINLSPGAVPKKGTGLDAAIALAIIAADESLESDGPILVAGELGLDGQIRENHGQMAMFLTKEIRRFSMILYPEESSKRISELPTDSLPLFLGSRLEDYAEALRGGGVGSSYSGSGGMRVKNAAFDSAMYDQMSAASQAILAIAASGRHNVLFYGPPGSGKTTAARLLAGLIPPSSRAVASQQLRIHFHKTNFAHNNDGLSAPIFGTDTAFREPHHNSSVEGILGGGRFLQPGELSLAHGGAILFDEAPEYRRNVLQSLREPMESGSITITRADGSTRYPCDAMFLFTMNLCPCGNRGRSDAVCLCSPQQLSSYWRQLGGALYDRIDIKYFMPDIPSEIDGVPVIFLRMAAIANPQDLVAKTTEIISRVYTQQVEAVRVDTAQSMTAQSGTARTKVGKDDAMWGAGIEAGVLSYLQVKAKSHWMSRRQQRILYQLSLTIAAIRNVMNGTSSVSIEQEDIDAACFCLLPEAYAEYF